MSAGLQAEEAEHGETQKPRSAFKARVALEALKGEKTAAELSNSPRPMASTRP